MLRDCQIVLPSIARAADGMILASQFQPPGDTCESNQPEGTFAALTFECRDLFARCRVEDEVNGMHGAAAPLALRC